MGKKGILGAVGLLFLCGCGVTPTENQREAHQQTIGAAAFVAKTSTEPAVAQAGADAEATARILQDTLVGKPDAMKPYSHEEAVKIVTVVKKEYDESQAPWYKRWAGTLLTGLGILSTALGVAGFFYPPAAIANRFLQPVAGALTQMKQTADAHPDDVLPLDSLQTVVSSLARDPVIGAKLTPLLQQAHLDQLVHAPEAADPPPAPAPAPTS